ncbi:MAG: 3-deoxy-7-phosphoheptulonate synthase [Nanoarchaeota archaeon]|nr:3-deoxy-7-phosphoheptulonate synthase [Nanoarchaeota archaeon]MBU4351563.1 3-deoxy-7-phosphoheptulonate synthase [Nanoarchaeota archaeon]
MEKEELIFIAGPCAVESEKKLLDIARELKNIGVTHLRGGAFKPRTSPDSFQGLGEKGLKYLHTVKKKTGLKIVSEILDIGHANLFKKYKIDILQIGARNMDNYELLKGIANKFSDTPVLLKRGFHAKKKEFIGAINYLRRYGHNAEIIACERGIRSFSNGDYDRFTLDVSFISDLKKDKTFNYRVFVDPSHAAGRADIVENLAYSGVSCGADGLIIEVKKEACDTPLCDSNQAITIKKLREIVDNCKKIRSVLSEKDNEIKVKGGKNEIFFR